MTRHRLKDGALVSSDTTSSSSTLEINDASLTDTGSYRCRASNDYTAVYSSPATVVVRGACKFYELVDY